MIFYVFILWESLFFDNVGRSFGLSCGLPLLSNEWDSVSGANVILTVTFFPAITTDHATSQDVQV